jgi:hypothetical protein
MKNNNPKIINLNNFKNINWSKKCPKLLNYSKNTQKNKEMCN